MAEKIPTEAVASSNLAGIGYDAHKLILAIHFKNGDIWHYGSVPANVLEELYAALSKGTYYNDNIRAKFPAEKMTGPCAKCGAKGWIGDTCADCGCGLYSAPARHWVFGSEPSLGKRSQRAACGDWVKPSEVTTDRDYITCASCRGLVEEFENGDI